jgi:molecular chaperone Hsp33
MTDTLHKFITEDGAVRGELVDISDTWRQVQARHDYPPAVRTLLGDMLAATVKRDELLGTDVDTLRHRLFWEETIRLFEPLQPQFRCSCSRDKVAGMLKMLGQDEVQSALDELGQLGIDCDFCGQHYEFDKVDCAQLFASEAPLPAPDARH